MDYEGPAATAIDEELPVWLPYPRARLTVVLPFFNERDFIGDTLASLAVQTEPFVLVLVDNGSTDGSAAVAAGRAAALGLDCRLIQVARPGKVAALQAGLAQVTTPLVATCDADCWYPPHYLATLARVLDRGGTVAAGAYYVGRTAPAAVRHREWRHIALAARWRPFQCHAGGAGQAFRTAALRRAGGFDPHVWNWVLEDHEIVARLLPQGRMTYDADLWCCPSPRRRDRPSIRWSLIERLRYHVTRAAGQPAFFHDWLAPRLRARRLSSDRIREAAFHPETVDAGFDAAPRAVR